VADHLRRLAPSPADRAKVQLLREHDPQRRSARRPHDDELDVPDPYYGGPEGFEEAYEIIERSGQALLTSLLGQA
jgi:protein-tyrosine phosphatase